MPQDYSHIIQTTKNGVLDSVTPRAHVEELVQRAMASGKPIVIHLHGGLVSKSAAYEIVKDLQDLYKQADHFPIFIVWRTGLIDALKNVDEVLKQPLFKRVQHFLIKQLVAKYGGVVGGKALGGGNAPTDTEIELELLGQGQSAIPFENVNPDPEAETLSPGEEAQLENQIAKDSRLGDAWDEKLETDLSEAPDITVPLSQEILDEARSELDSGSPKGLISTALLVKNIAQIAGRVIYRFYHHRDHGFHATLVEEILRKLFVHSIGTSVWGMMKKDSADTFGAADAEGVRGGGLLIQLLGEAFLAAQTEGKPLPSISLIGHSAGSCYACNLLDHLSSEQQRQGSPWQKLSHPVDKLVFLAPAVTHKIFAPVLRQHQKKPIFKDFRMYSLKDAHERGYYEIPILYPASLLYIISGLLEKDDDQGTADMPLVGMQRFGRTDHPFQDADVKTVWQFFAKPGRAVWSGSTGGDGLNCDTLKHGEFDVGKSATMASVIHFLTH